MNKDDVGKLIIFSDKNGGLTKEEFDKYMDELVMKKIETELAKTQRERRIDTLSKSREEHQLRYSKERYGDELHTSIAYFNGWSNISSLVRLAFNAKNVARIEDKEKANAMAKELSDIFFKYARFE